MRYSTGASRQSGPPAGAAPIPQDHHTWFTSDAHFYNLYPPSVRSLARYHWTPLSVVRMTVEYLVPADNVRILDIGSGAGTYCLAGAYCKPNALFVGVEQRKELVAHAELARSALKLENVQFLHRNFTQLDLKQYHHFYFYNSFHENIAGTNKIDDNIAYSLDLYNYYTRYLYRELESMPTGTRIVTYHSLGYEIPPGYHLVESRLDELIKFWIKI